MEQVLLTALGFILEVFSSPYGLRQTGLYMDAKERRVRMCLGSIGFFGFSSACISHMELWIRKRAFAAREVGEPSYESHMHC